MWGIARLARLDISKIGGMGNLFFPSRRGMKREKGQNITHVLNQLLSLYNMDVLHQNIQTKMKIKNHWQN
jgi:hypothetical protein